MGAKKSSPFEAEDHQKDELPSRTSTGQALAPPTPKKSSSLESALHNDAPIKSSRSRTSLGSAMDLMGFQRQVVRAQVACVLGRQVIKTNALHVPIRSELCIYEFQCSK